MAQKDNPCAQGLTPQCFKEYPEWAKKAFAYRLMNMLTPPAISRRLQKLLKGAWVFPGIVVAPDLDPPPGTVILPAPGPPPVGLPGEIPTGDVLPPPINWENPPAESPASPPFLDMPFLKYPSPTAPSAPPATYEVFASANDGYITSLNADYMTARNALVGTQVVSNVSGHDKAMAAQDYGTIDCYVHRSYFDFDLSAVPAKTPVSVVLKIPNPYEAFMSNVSAQGSTHDIPLALEDFPKYEGLEFGHATWITGDNLITFNAAGLAYVKAKAGGLLKLCLREYGKDYLNVGRPPEFYNYNGCWYANDPDPDRKPMITILA